MRHKVFAVSLSQTRPKRNGARRVTHPRPLLSDDKDPTRASHGIRPQKPTGFSLVAFQHRHQTPSQWEY